jgi:hypothetical protein
MPCPRPGPSIPQVPGDARTAGSACSVTPIALAHALRQFAKANALTPLSHCVDNAVRVRRS